MSITSRNGSFMLYGNCFELRVSGKKINRVACGSAHSLAWSTNKPVNAGRLPADIPMEYNQLQGIPIQVRSGFCFDPGHGSNVVFQEIHIKC